MRALLLLLVCPLPARAQPPAIFQEGVRNAASRIPPSLPGGSLAPGALFTVGGVGFGDSPAAIRIQVGRFAARILSVKPRRVEAMLSPGMPAGEVALTLTRENEASRPFPVRVTPSSFGIFSRNGKGWGPGRIDQVDGAGRRTANSS